MMLLSTINIAISTFLLAHITIAQVFNECPEGYEEFMPGRCFGFFEMETSDYDFAKAKIACTERHGYVTSVLSANESDYLATKAKFRFIIGLQCNDNEDLHWEDNCNVVYENFANPEETGCLTYSMDKDDTLWQPLYSGSFVKYLVCSYNYGDFYSTCYEQPPPVTTEEPKEYVRMEVQLLIIMISCILVVLVLVMAIGGCFFVLNKKAHEERRRRESNARRQTHLMELAHTMRLGNGINGMARAMYDISTTEIGDSSDQDIRVRAQTLATLEASNKILRIPSSRYTPFPEKIFDEWEIDRRLVNIDFAHKLGQGAFGSVFRGTLLNQYFPNSMSIMELNTVKKENDAVAIKMLHESADRATEMAFLQEIENMKKIGYHERLMNLLACVTDSHPSMLIVEYCAHGDLLNYMRDKRKNMMDNEAPMLTIDRSKIITQKQQLMFCIQVAFGLEYLSSRGFVHRDIAARNILVDENHSCKIGDFGLCREVEKGDEHYHSRGGRLPLKWMSPEAIEKYDFSIASDVWAFGVLLFEIITLGGVPYPDWPAAEQLSRLRRGLRMDRPDHCNDHMFSLMQSCWIANPDERPSFYELRMKLGIALEEVSEEDYYLRLNARAMYYTIHSDDGEKISNVVKEEEAVMS